MFKWYMTMIDYFYSDYESGNITKVGFCGATNNLIELAIHETDITKEQFNELLMRKQFLESEVLGL